MEEDIKILENDIAYNKRQMKEIGSYIPFDIKLMERVENLIKELKNSDDLLISMALELEQNKECIRELEEDNQKFESGKFLTPAQCVRIGKDYIPKSKVKEKIEEINSELEEKYSAEKISVFSGNTYMEKFKLLGKLQALQELMEDK